ncbi:helix-turn-helix domain-containing protein [Spongiibacter sp. UBA1325]|uniref:helix-turn-helix domain-containing protein n=1 Tax=Spongiibacter sp. UBA1325 TaxID=1947543 RepID=UPI00257FAF77|nr:helix-turn-helix transcriptional regulator [Spongiibacter sp. UBA1325]|tara:strand:+ start:1115 stop:1474 length:360 start_codon:yes stop_codon:yes gene_type:complete
MMNTPYGKEIRKLRIDKGLTLKALADQLGVASSYVSAIEKGRKKLTNPFVENVVKAMCLSTDEEKLIWDAAFQSQSEFTIDVSNSNEQARSAVAMLARNFGSLPAEKLDQIRKLAADVD